jgi:hypothetical protein
MFLKITIFLLLIAVPSTCHAKPPRLYDFVVGGAIKNLAKIYIKTVNLAKLKDKYIKKIATMREDKFQKYYKKFYVVYKELPPEVKESYIFEENITKTQAISMINKVDKRDLITIINKIPSDFIVKQTKYYSHPPQGQLPQNSQVNEMFLWRRIIQKV